MGAVVPDPGLPASAEQQHRVTEERWSVLIVEPQPIFSAGLRGILELDPEFSVAGEAGEVNQAYELFDATHPAVVTIEASLSGLSGSAVARELLRRDPGCRILVIASQLDEQHVVDALASGVRGYVGKEQPISEVLRALRFVARGQSYLAPTISRYVLDQFVRMSRTGQSGPLLSLTPRERDIFELTARGVATTDIAGRLGITKRTVDTHRTRVMQKLDVHSRADLVRFAVRLGVLVSS